MGLIDDEEDAVVLGGRGDGLDPSAAMAVMGQLDSGAKVRVRWEVQHNK
jgi:hypothetical protein